MSQQNQLKKKQSDPLKSIKFKGYCWSQTPPGEDTTMEDLVSFAKFYLCKSSRVLWKDPIWDKYTDEEILIEYFAHLFSRDELSRKDFEASMTAGTDLYGEEIYDWLDRKIKENQEEMQRNAEQQPDKISFSPEKGLDKEE